MQFVERQYFLFFENSTVWSLNKHLECLWGIIKTVLKYWYLRSSKIRWIICGSIVKIHPVQLKSYIKNGLLREYSLTLLLELPHIQHLRRSVFGCCWPSSECAWCFFTHSSVFEEVYCRRESGFTVELACGELRVQSSPAQCCVIVRFHLS